MVSAAIQDSTCFSSLYLLEKKSGIVKAPTLSEYLRRSLATRRKFKYVPIDSPTAVQVTSASPAMYASPGRPIRR